MSRSTAGDGLQGGPCSTRSLRNHAACIGNDCDGVLSGEIVTDRYFQLAVERHLDDLEHAHERGLHFDAGIAETSSLTQPDRTVRSDAEVKTRTRFE